MSKQETISSAVIALSNEMRPELAGTGGYKVRPRADKIIVGLSDASKAEVVPKTFRGIPVEIVEFEELDGR